MTDIHPVYLVGAGPGDPDLLTVKAHRLITEVDTIVYDKLVANPILDLFPNKVMRVFAGKQAAHHHMPQNDINTLLVDLAKAGQKVMRLKGGDPFVFGRGGEEAMYLAQNGIPFEVIPGVTSSAGCAAYAGIPLTHRDFAQSVRFVTGHTKGKHGLKLNWKSLADPDTTLVIYMGITNVAEITRELIAAKLPKYTPVALINKGTRPDQEILISILEKLPSDISTKTLTGPTLLIIGRVVELAQDLAWYPNSLEKNRN